jgi:hypothetical protein
MICSPSHENIDVSTATNQKEEEKDANFHRSLFILDYSTAFSSTEANLNVTNTTTTLNIDDDGVPINLVLDSKEDFSPLIRRFKLNQKQTAYESSFVQLRDININAAHLKGKTYVNSEWK